MIEEIYHRPPIRIALMGVGRSMISEHLEVFRKHPGLFEVVCACDPLKERRDIVKKSFPKCKMYRDFRDMLNERNIDLIDIATPTYMHLKDVLLALEYNSWTLIESPMTITPDEAAIVKGAAARKKNRLIVLQRGMFNADFLLAKQEMLDKRLGAIHNIEIHREDYVRRDDWQTIRHTGGGACYYAMPDLILQALKLLPAPPVQLWSELKRVASVGETEDVVKLCIKTREPITAEVEYSGAVLPMDRGPSFKLWGEFGSFTTMPGAKEGLLRVVDPKFAWPRRRSSVRTPKLKSLHEDLPIVEETIKLPPNTLSGPSAFWKHVYDSVRTGVPFPITVDDAIDSLKLVYLIKKNSPYASGK